jgi:hypothetical protein
MPFLVASLMACNLSNKSQKSESQVAGQRGGCRGGGNLNNGGVVTFENADFATEIREILELNAGSPVTESHLKSLKKVVIGLDLKAKDVDAQDLAKIPSHVKIKVVSDKVEDINHVLRQLGSKSKLYLNTGLLPSEIPTLKETKIRWLKLSVLNRRLDVADVASLPKSLEHLEINGGVLTEDAKAELKNRPGFNSLVIEDITIFAKKG